MFLIGLTGGIASGKSAVCKILKELNIPVIDADIIARFVVEPNQPAWKKIMAQFGQEYFLESGELDRQKIGKMIFADPVLRKKLNDITHPAIHKEMKKQVWKYFWKGEQFVVLEMPLLYETRRALDYIFKVIVIRCEDEIQLDRLMARNELTTTEAIQRIEAQMPLEEKCDMADFVIENSGNFFETRQQIEDMVKLFRASNQHVWNKVKLLVLIGVVGVIFMAILLQFLS